MGCSVAGLVRLSIDSDAAHAMALAQEAAPRQQAPGKGDEVVARGVERPDVAAVETWARRDRGASGPAHVPVEGRQELSPVREEHVAAFP